MYALVNYNITTNIVSKARRYKVYFSEENSGMNRYEFKKGGRGFKVEIMVFKGNMKGNKDNGREREKEKKQERKRKGNGREREKDRQVDRYLRAI